MMKTLLATVSALVVLSAPAFADDPYNQGVNYGYQAGRDFCNGSRSEPRHSPQVEQFLAGCKDGFLRAIDDNTMCKANLSPSGLWDDMLRYRAKICS